MEIVCLVVCYGGVYVFKIDLIVWKSYSQKTDDEGVSSLK